MKLKTACHGRSVDTFKFQFYSKAIPQYPRKGDQRNKPIVNISLPFSKLIANALLSAL